MPIAGLDLGVQLGQGHFARWLLWLVQAIGIDGLFFAILIAMNLQTSFLTPPFGFSLFYLKGCAPPEVRTLDIYRGVVPFIILQALVLFTLAVYPEMYGFAKH